jgi:hypothetical protein
LSSAASFLMTSLIVLVNSSLARSCKCFALTGRTCPTGTGGGGSSGPRRSRSHSARTQSLHHDAGSSSAHSASGVCKASFRASFITRSSATVVAPRGKARERETNFRHRFTRDLYVEPPMPTKNCAESIYTLTIYRGGGGVRDDVHRRSTEYCLMIIENGSQYEYTNNIIYIFYILYA